MMQKNSAILVLLLVWLMPVSVRAAILDFKPEQTQALVGDDFVVDVYLDTEGQSVNAVDLKLTYTKSLQVRDVSKTGSVFPLWIREPSFTKDRVNLVAGIPSGAVFSDGLVARLVVQGLSTGRTSIGVDTQSAVLLNDGLATQATLKSGRADISIVPRPPGTTPITVAASDLSPEDKEKPEKFSIQISKDAGFFAGRSFVTFYAADARSGIDHYEIKEGGGLFRVAVSPFLLSDQDLHSVIRVRAYDGAGNWREAVWPGLFKRAWWWIMGIFGLR